jgi:DNA-binding XRE family transcriptional regulator
MLSIDEILHQAAARNVPLPPPPLRRATRTAAGLSQAEVAAVTGVDRATIARWELGTREPRGDLRVTYARVLEAIRRGV